jgi:hypothetical protein
METERLSARLARMAAACGGDAVTLRALLPNLGGGDHALVALLVGLCFMHPLPMPGISWGLAALVVAAGWRMARGLPVWLPASLAERPIPARVPRALFSRAARLFAKSEGFIRPRGRWLTSGAGSRALAGGAIAFCGVQLLAPLPPPTNYPPAIALLFLSLGVLESDGLFLVCGYAASAASAVLLGVLLSTGFAGARALLARF